MNNPLAAVASLFRRQAQPLPHVQIKYVVPTKREATEAQRRVANLRASVNAQLAVYAAVVPLDQRRRETEEWFARAARTRASIGEGR